MPKLSVLLPVYNGVDNYPTKQMAISIHSILALDVDLELIIINDGSTDNTFDHLIKIWKDIPNVRLINLIHNQGQADSLNVGLEAARGNYIWQWSVRAQAYPQAAQMVNVLDNDPDVGFVYGQMESNGGAKNYLHRPPREFDRQRFINKYLCNFYMYRRLPGLQYVEQLKLLDGRTIGICDRDMVMQLMDKGAAGYALPDTLCVAYYNGGRHTMNDITKYRHAVDDLFSTRWRHMLCATTEAI